MRTNRKDDIFVQRRLGQIFIFIHVKSQDRTRPELTHYTTLVVLVNSIFSNSNSTCFIYKTSGQNTPRQKTPRQKTPGQKIPRTKTPWQESTGQKKPGQKRPWQKSTRLKTPKLNTRGQKLTGQKAPGHLSVNPCVSVKVWSYSWWWWSRLDNIWLISW